MNGKILGNGVISGNDGKRYHFEPSDIKNLDGRDISQLSGKEVDFVAQDDKASEIFITQSAGLNINNLTTIKILIFITIALGILNNFSLDTQFLWHFLCLLSSAVFIYAVYLIKKMANSNTILINAVAAEICFFLSYNIFFAYNNNTLMIIFALIVIEFRRRYYKELALLTSQWLFKLRFYLLATWTLFYIISIYHDTEIISDIITVVAYAGMAVTVIAWLKTKKIANKANI